MKQKLGLCCALIHDPDLLILDEPTTGVDPLSRRQFWQLIDRIRADRPGMSVVVATAYMDEAERFDWLVAMDGGRVLATGSPAQLRQQTQTDSLEQAFIALLPQARGVWPQVLIPARSGDSGQTAIEAEALTRCFGDFTAVADVSFRIQRGEIFGFLGSNGCGKTTTMKMLTGLLPASSGVMRLFGREVDSHDIAVRKRVGYMSQSFSLYNELSVEQNLNLHARIFALPPDQIRPRVDNVIEDFGLQQVRHQEAEQLPLGLRQRLSLAVAVIHRPEILILDEPTSGVDPLARDQFWRLLVTLSRAQGVTIFISTHFMNEAQRCDRISLMHAGRVLAQGAPDDLIRAQGAQNLEQAFIRFLEREVANDIEVPGTGAPSLHADDAASEHFQKQHWQPPEKRAPEQRAAPQHTSWLSTLFHWRRAWAYARREGLEILRDPIRLSFALLGPLILLIAFGYGISFDVENIAFAALDHDQSPASREYLDNFSSSRYFSQAPPLRDGDDLDRRLRSGELTLAIEIPPGFGKQLKRQASPEIALWLDGTMPFLADTARGYALGVHALYLHDLAQRWHATSATEPPSPSPLSIETRFRYNQDFKSVYAIVPGSIMMLLIWIPAMMTAAGIVREKEMGSIANFYATPVIGLEFLLGKQAPYVVLGLINFCLLATLALCLFKVPIKGSALALVAGAVLYLLATTALGLLISSFMKTQIAALFGTAIITTVPAISFSGFFAPVASLTANAQVISAIFPSSYFQKIVLGTFTKGIGVDELGSSFAILGLLTLVYWSLGLVLLKTQER